MKRFLAAALLAWALPAGAADLDLATLFRALAAQKPQAATYVETRHLALLDKPLESRGELAFTPPDRLEKRTVSPRAERVLVEGDRVTLERGGKTLRMGLRDNPAVAILVESIRATLAGDLAGLTRAYSAALQGTRAKWKLTLRPLDPALATLVEHVEISGAEARVRTVEIFQADGDRSVLTIEPGRG